MSALFSAQHTNICAVELCTTAHESHVFFSQRSIALSIVHPRHNPSSRIQSDPLLGLTGGRSSRVAPQVSPNDTLEGVQCHPAVLHWSRRNPLLAFIVPHGYSKSTCSRNFAQYFWLIFCFGFHLEFFDGEGEFKKLLPFHLPGCLF